MEFSLRSTHEPCLFRVTFQRVVPANAGTHTARNLVLALEQRPFFTFEARGDGSLRSQGRPADSSCEADRINARLDSPICDSPARKGPVMAYRGSVAFGYQAMLGTRRATSRLCICGMVGIILKFEPRVVSAKTRWSLQRQRFVSEAAIPRHIAIGRHDQIISMEFCPQCVGLTRPYRRQIDAPLRLDVHVSTRAALFMGVHAGVALDRDRDRGVWLDVPHRIDQIAGVLGLQLQSDLTSQFA